MNNISSRISYLTQSSIDLLGANKYVTNFPQTIERRNQRILTQKLAATQGHAFKIVNFYRFEMLKSFLTLTYALFINMNDMWSWIERGKNVCNSSQVQGPFRGQGVNNNSSTWNGKIGACARRGTLGHLAFVNVKRLKLILKPPKILLNRIKEIVQCLRDWLLSDLNSLEAKKNE